MMWFHCPWHEWPRHFLSLVEWPLWSNAAEWSIYDQMAGRNAVGGGQSDCVRLLVWRHSQEIAPNCSCGHVPRWTDVSELSLRKGQWHYQWRLAEVCCLLVENYSNSRQVWSSRSFLQFLRGLRPNLYMGDGMQEHAGNRHCLL